MPARLRSLLWGLAFLTVSTALMLEIALRVADRLGLATPAERLTEPSFYRDENPAFGVWHPPNASYLARADCFEVTYYSNSHGARDRERARESDEPRVVVLGDSFVEGIGVERHERMTDLLEEETGLAHLNFGTAGNFGSIQQWLLYETLARDFDHDLVLIFMFPNNDFFENDPQRFWQRDRYRPYLRRVGEDYEVYYPISLEESRRRAERQLRWNVWYNRIYLYRLAAFLDSQVRIRMAQGETTPYGFIGYVQFDEEDLERLFYSYRRIRDLGGGREVVIFTIPRLNDLLYQAGEGHSGALPGRLEAFAAGEPRLRYHDLMPAFVEHRRRTGGELGDYFLPCDGHWSVRGNAVAAAAVKAALAPSYAAARAKAGRRAAGNEGAP